MLVKEKDVVKNVTLFIMLCLVARYNKGLFVLVYTYEL